MNIFRRIKRRDFAWMKRGSATITIIRFEDQAWSWLMTTAQNNHQSIDDLVNDIIMNYAHGGK